MTNECGIIDRIGDLNNAIAKDFGNKDLYFKWVIGSGNDIIVVVI
jgi:hypothetical protein